jgi:medium-chain acyl-[acyl-carrier-protein] hydrolase
MLAENYTYRAVSSLELPITVYSGTQDPHVSERQATEWKKETKGPCNVVLMEGDHFFLNQKRDAILQSLARELTGRHARSQGNLLPPASQKIVSV